MVLVVLAWAEGTQASELTRFVRFLAGCRLLAQVSVTNPSKASKALAWLVEHTGITPEKAARIVERYRGRPDEWQKVLVLTAQELEKNSEGE
jgi:hypothetical protein